MGSKERMVHVGQSISEREDKQQITDLVASVAQYRDLGLWTKLESFFVSEPYINDTSLTKEEPGKRPIRLIIDSWRRELKNYFYATRHTVKNMRINISGKKAAEARSLTEARFFILDGGIRYMQTVVGTYTYKFVKKAGDWKIGQIEFTLLNQSLSVIGAA
jgi:SnoaL-like domain